MERNSKAFAKMKGKRGEHKIIYTDSEGFDGFGPFSLPVIERSIEFGAEIKIDEDEWAYVEIDKDQKDKMVIPYARSASATVSLNRATKEDYNNFEVIYTVWLDDDSSVTGITFQKVTSARRLKNKIVLFGDDILKLESFGAGVEVLDQIDAYYDGDNRIYFKNFSTIRCMFDGFDEFYRKATKEEVDRLKSAGYMNIAEGVKIGTRNLKMIAQISEKVNLEDPSYRRNFNEYFRKYNEMGLTIGDDGKIVVDDEKGLGSVLSSMLGRYYTSELTGEKALAVQARALS